MGEVLLLVKCDHCVGGYKDVNPQNSRWAPEYVYILCDKKDNTVMGDMMECGDWMRCGTEQVDPYVFGGF